MKNKKGYLLLESIISLSIIITISLSLYFFIYYCNKYKKSVEDKIELYEQGTEIQYHINQLIESSSSIISIRDLSGNTTYGNTENYIKIVSIKCKCKNEYLNDINDKNKEISYKKNNHKIFINTLYSNGASESGGYEIGDYVDFISVKINDNKVTVKLNLSKNKEKYETEFHSYMKDF